MTDLFTDFEISKDLNSVFIKNTVNIMAIGSGKTYSCGKIACEKILSSNKDILLITTMSNALVDGIVKEICKCLLKHNFNIDLVNEILKFKNNNSNLLKKIGVIILNTHNPLSLKDLERSKIIITNHAYFFPHGHDSNYNNNCYKIQSHLEESGKKLVCIFDEFDQFHKMGLVVIPLNYFVGNNFIDKNRNQTYITDHSFRYCHKLFMEKSHMASDDSDFDDDYYYRLPEICYRKKLENNSEGIKYFKNSISGQYDFKTLVLNNLNEISDTQIVYCNKFGKKVGNYYIRRFDEVIRCNINSDIFQDEGVTSKFLKINNSIILVTQKLEVEDSSGCKWKLDDRESVIEFAKTNLTKDQWINYYNTLAAEGKNLYITNMIIRKRQFNFNSSNYYLTATPGKLKSLGYSLYTKNQFKTPCKIKKIDIFIVPNKSNAASDMHILFNQLKGSDIKTIAIANKKEVVEKFISENKVNTDFNNVNAVISDVISDLGREASNINISDKNITYVYQKGNQTQGTNYSNHVLLFQDCHIKIDIIERSIPVGKNDIEVSNYLDEEIHSINQSALRILRGDLQYKSIVLFLDTQSEEIELANYLSGYLKQYGIEVNLIYAKEAKNLADRKVIFDSVLKHIHDRHYSINLGDNIDVYTYSNDNLIKNDNRVKHNENEIVRLYNEAVKHYLEENPNKSKLSHREASKILGISRDSIDRALKNKR